VQVRKDRRRKHRQEGERQGLKGEYGRNRMGVEGRKGK
jgi:hypothetical protein